MNTNVRRFAQLAAAKGMALASPAPEWAEASLLRSFGVDGRRCYRRAAALVAKIPPAGRRASPGELPFEQATKFPFALDPRTATGVGLELPPELLLLNEKVIE